jgi:Glycosyl transferase family 2
MIASALLPSRNRPDLLRRSIRSLFLMADRPVQIEVLVAADPDDPFTWAVAEEERASLYVAPERWGYQNLHMYFNMLAEHAQGDWLMLWNDDATMQTAGWDQEMNHKSIGILALHGNHEPFNAFPAVHRLLYEAMGHFSLSNHNDSWLHDVALGAGCLIDTRIHVYHDRYDLTGNNRDEIYQASSTGYRTQEYYGPELSALRAQDIQKVVKVLNGPGLSESGDRVEQSAS